MASYSARFLKNCGALDCRFRALLRNERFRCMSGGRFLVSGSDRNLKLASYRLLHTSSAFENNSVKVTILIGGTQPLTLTAKEGESLFDCMRNNNVDVDGYGACDGLMACSTCHLIFKPEDFERLPSERSEEEEDMLDVMENKTATSRLGCQVIVTKELEGMEIIVPATRSDMRDNATAS